MLDGGGLGRPKLGASVAPHACASWLPMWSPSLSARRRARRALFRANSAAWAPSEEGLAMLWCIGCDVALTQCKKTGDASLGLPPSRR